MTTLTAMADLEQTAEKIQRLEAELAQAKVERDALVAKALEEGATVRKVAAIAGVSKSRVDQIRRGVYKSPSPTETGPRAGGGLFSFSAATFPAPETCPCQWTTHQEHHDNPRS